MVSIISTIKLVALRYFSTIGKPNKPKMLHEMPHMGFTFELSADGHNILFTRDDNRASDIVLIE